MSATQPDYVPPAGARDPASLLASASDLANRLDARGVYIAPVVDGVPCFQVSSVSDLKPAPWTAEEFGTPDEAERLCVVTDCFDRFTDKIRHAGTSILTFMDGDAAEYRHVQISGPAADFDVAVEIIQTGLTGGLLCERTWEFALVAANDNKPRARFDLKWFDDIEDNVGAKETFVKGVFGVGEFTTVSGLPGAGKSVIITDAACHVAAGMEWHGRRVRQGLVVYVAAERKALTERRMIGFRKKHGVKDLPLLVLGGRIDLTTNLNDARALADTINQAASACGEQCVWVIIDTLTRTFGPGDQHAPKDMGRFVQSCDEITRLTKAHVTVIHHTTWSGERGKGAIDLDGAVDASFLVKKSGKTYTLECNGANDGDEGIVASFSMEGVPVGVDEDGETTFAPVVIPSVGGPADQLVAGLRGHASKALDALVAAVASGGIVADHEEHPSFGALMATEEQWREAYYATDKNSLPDTMKKRFGRARLTLIDSGAVESRGQFYWPRDAGHSGTF